MNKKLLYLAALLLMLAGFSSCDNEKALPPAFMPDIEGDGTGVSPYNVGTALMKIYAGEYNSKKVYVHGYVSQITEFGEAYGNITYYISDDGTQNNELEVYRGLGLNGAKFTSIGDLHLGDEVIILATLTLYNDKYAETGQGAVIVSLNGSPWTPDPVIDPAGEGTKESPYNVTKALDLILGDEVPAGNVYVSGVISAIDNVDPSYGNATYYISDSGSTLNQLEIYRGKYLGGAKFTSAEQIKVGDTVTVYGQVVNFNGTAEFTTGSMITVHNGQENDPNHGGPTAEPTGEGTLASPFNIAKALQFIQALPDQNATAEEYYLEGIVSQIDGIDTSYGNATYYLSDDGTPAGQLEVYRGYYLNGAKFTATDQIKVGDKLVIAGKLVNFKGNTPEVTTGSKIISINGQGASEEPTPDPVGTPEGEGTQASPYNVAKAQAIITAGTYTEDAVYVKGKISKIDNVDTGSYGNATYFISDDGTEAGQLEVFRGYYLDGAKFTAADQIKVGDEVIILGKLTNYNGTHEVTTGSKIISLNGVTSGSSEEPTPDPVGTPEGEGTESSPYNVAKAQAIITAGTYTQDAVYVKGTISKIESVDTGSYGNATYFISDDGTEAGQLEVFRGYFFDGAKFTSADQIKVGDKVVILGKLTNYNGTHEVTTGSKIITLNGQGAPAAQGAKRK